MPKKNDGALIAQQDFESRLKTEVDAARADGEALGACAAINLNLSFNRLLKLLVIYKTLKSKEYKEYGMTAAQFCKAVGESYSNMHEVLKDMRPVFEAFSTEIGVFSGCELNKIKLLGREISTEIGVFKDDGSVEWQGERYERSEIKKLIGFIAESYEDRLKVAKRQSGIWEKKYRDADSEVLKLHKDLSGYKDINVNAVDPWLDITRLQLVERWDAFLSAWKFFVMHENATANDNAQELMVTFYDSIIEDMHSVNKLRKDKTGESYTRGQK